MKKLKQTLALLFALTMAFGATACGGGEESEANTWKGSDDVTVEVDDAINAGDPDISGQTIYWMAIYDLNPQNNEDRSVALTLFEDVYGAKIEYIATTSDTKFDDLSNRINGGDPIDMFPYEWDAVPNGVTKGQYQPLDEYLDLEDEIWDGVRSSIESMKYNGHYYVVPYAICDPLAITYSRVMMDENGLDDPYELYQKGEWDWDAFMSMMKDFVDNAGDGETRYGCSGWFGQAMVQSTGQTIVTYDGTAFANNSMNADIEAAELNLEEINRLGLYDATWSSYFPEDGHVLFYGMAPWHLATSNAKNEDMDLFVVPFPKQPGNDTYYLNCNFGAKMLVKGSDKGDAVAAYIKCERLAETMDEYRDAAREKALIVSQNAAGKVTGYLTEEQYDFMQTWYDPEVITPVFDFGYGMGSRMYSETYDYYTRGVMNNFMDVLIVQYEGAPDTWAELRGELSGIVDEVVKEFNAKAE